MARRRNHKPKRQSVAVRESYDAPQLMDPREYLTDDPSFGYGTLMNAGLADRTRGDAWPAIKTQAELENARGVSRLLLQTSPSAIGAMSALTNYVVGTGFRWRVTPTCRTEPEIAQAVGRVVDEWLDQCDFVGDLDRELFWRSREDGEYFLSLWPQSDGTVEVRTIEPEQIKQPANCRAIEDHYEIAGPCEWTGGICHAAGDSQRILGYFVQWSSSDGDYDFLPAWRVEHCKLNVHRSILRGIPDLFAVQPWLQSAEKLLRNTAQSTAVQAAIAFIRRHAPGTTSTQVNSLRTSLETGSYGTPTSQGNIRRSVAKYEPGSVLDATSQTYEPGPATMGAQAFLAVEQAVLRIVGTRWNMPEYLISGDASNANLSSSMTAEAPFVKACEAMQGLYRSRWHRLIWKVVAHSYRTGRLSRLGASWEQLQDACDIVCVPPTVGTRDAMVENAVNESLQNAGVMSKRTRAQRAGLDFDQEVLDGADEKQQPSPFGMPALQPGQQRSTESESRRAAVRAIWEAYHK